MRIQQPAGLHKINREREERGAGGLQDKAIDLCHIFVVLMDFHGKSLVSINYSSPCFTVHSCPIRPYYTVYFRSTVFEI